MFLFEQFTRYNLEDYQADSDEIATDNENTQQTSEADQDLTPIKKFYLVQKIRRLRDVLRELNYHDIENVDLLLKFSSSLTYPTLLRLTNAILDQLKMNNEGQYAKGREEIK